MLKRSADPPWKSWYGRMIDAVDEAELYDLQFDWGESRNVASQNADVVARLKRLVLQVCAELGDYDRIGQSARFFDPGPARPDLDRWRN